MRPAPDLLTAGAPLARAEAAAIFLHGRGATAAGILDLAAELAVPEVACLAPQAEGGSWYPYSFLAPLSANEPYLSRALDQIGAAIDAAIAGGLPAHKIVLVGFSQGGCLALEYAVRNPRGLSGIAGLSAGLIGPPGMARHDKASLAGTHAFLGCSNIDGHIPLARVHETTTVMRALGADVDERIYPGMGHTINADELGAVRALLVRATRSPQARASAPAHTQ